MIVNRIFLIILTLSVGLISFHTNSQSSVSQLKLKRGFNGSVGYSDFRYNSKNLTKFFPAPELRIGLHLEKSIKKSFGISSAINLGLRSKSPIAIDWSQFPDNPYLFVEDEINKSVGSSNHYFFEVPINFFYQLEKFQASVGFNNRYFFNNGTQNDLVTNRYELGINVMLKFELQKRFRIYLMYLHGLRAIYESGSIQVNGQELSTVRGFYKTIGLGVEYHLR